MDIGMTRDRPRKPVGQILMGLVCLVIGAALIATLLPKWLTVPNREAPPEAYSALSRIDTSSYQSGRCPALKMAAAKALSDKILTNGEVRELDLQGRQLNDQYDAARAKNEALEEMGQQPMSEPPECPYGRDVFAN